LQQCPELAHIHTRKSRRVPIAQTDWWYHCQWISEKGDCTGTGTLSKFGCQEELCLSDCLCLIITSLAPFFFSRFWIGAADEVQSSENISITYYKGTNLSHSLYSFYPLFYQVLCFSASMLYRPINPPSTTSWTFRSSVHGLQCLTSALCLCAECVQA
jgi:hypothetical protein